MSFDFWGELVQSLASRILFEPLGSLINTRQPIFEVFSEILTFRDPQNISIAVLAMAAEGNTFQAWLK